MVGEEEEQTPPMYQRLPPMKMEGEDDEVNYRPHPKMRTNQSFGARILELCNSLPRFGGREGEPVEKFIKTVDACMMNMHMTSHEAALALFSPASPLYDRAASFANFARCEESYPNAQFWCAQDHTPRKAFVAYQPRRSSLSAITHSSASEPSASSRDATGDSIDDVASDPAAGTHRKPGVHGVAKRTDPRTMRRHRKRRKARVSRRPKQKGRDEALEQPAIPEEPEVQRNQCLRHYLYAEFFQKANRDEALKKFEAAKVQNQRTSVREYIWRLKMAHEDYKKAR